MILVRRHTLTAGQSNTIKTNIGGQASRPIPGIVRGGVSSPSGGVSAPSVSGSVG